MIGHQYPYNMKNSTILSIVIAASLLIIISLVTLILVKEKNYTGQLNEALSRQRIEYEQKLIEENQRFEVLLRQQREAMEGQSDREAEWIAKDIKVDETVKNITNLLKVKVSFKDKLIGGIENVNIAVTNNSAFKMEQVTVKLSYLKKGETYSTQMVTPVFLTGSPEFTDQIILSAGAAHLYRCKVLSAWYLTDWFVW